MPLLPTPREDNQKEVFRILSEMITDSTVQLRSVAISHKDQHIVCWNLNLMTSSFPPSLENLPKAKQWFSEIFGKDVIIVSVSFIIIFIPNPVYIWQIDMM